MFVSVITQRGDCTVGRRGERFQEISRPSYTAILTILGVYIAGENEGMAKSLQRVSALQPTNQHPPPSNRPITSQIFSARPRDLANRTQDEFLARQLKLAMQQGRHRSRSRYHSTLSLNTHTITPHPTLTPSPLSLDTHTISPQWCTP